MAKYHLTKKAVQDLDAIWAYTLNTWSEQKADEYYSALVKTFAEIAKRPCHLDKEYVEIHPGNIVKTYALRQVMDELKNKELI